MNSPTWKDKLYYGDNLDVLRKHIDSGSVDLVYLDPPFNSNATYNVLFKEKDGTRAASQLQAFEDTWEWDGRAAATFHDVVEHGQPRVSQALQAFRTLIPDSNMLAYLAMMAPRLTELHRVLRPTGSIYLHCDPTASHYLKLLMDAVFGPENFRNEITWKRSSAHSDAKQGRRAFGNVADILLYYTKTDDYVFNTQYTPYSEEYLRTTYNNSDPDGRIWKSSDLTGPGGAAKGNPEYEFLGVTRFWRFTKDNMQRLLKQGRIYQSKPGAVPRMKHYLDEMPGVPLQNIWDDIGPIPAQAAERLGYPTQKPEVLLERIIKTSSSEGDIVLDAFCGCGTAIAAAEGLGRKWIGIDVTQAAIVVIKQQRLSKIAPSTYEVIGEPVTVPDAEALAVQDPYQFQWWAVGKLSAHPIDRKKGRDRGIDGRLDFHDDHRDTKHVIISVKAGHLLPQYVRELRGVIERENAQIGVLISREKPTQSMKAEAASAGFYVSPWRSKKYPRIQLVTIADLFSSHPIEMPAPEISENISYRKGPKKERARPTQDHLFKQG
ncbi:MAG TPA: DNA methyltransferase [Bryobacteraceae bacterium]|jgi:DNA modification methylase|nr:DNA methyltransferase [Bryobacteraceae bacterium]